MYKPKRSPPSSPREGGGYEDSELAERERLRKMYASSSNSSSQGPHRRFYAPSEVAEHCTTDSLWLSWLGHVYDLTSLVAQYQDHKDAYLVAPLIKEAGNDISHWFDEKTQDIKTHIDPKSNLRVYYTPQGTFLHIPPPFPSTSWERDFETPWWQDSTYRIGKVSTKTRKIKIVNMLTKSEDILEVCAEETLGEIRDRYLDINAHAESYTWTRLGEPLSHDFTLDENGLVDESQELFELGMDDEAYIPAIHLYFDDDLTVA